MTITEIMARAMCEADQGAPDDYDDAFWKECADRQAQAALAALEEAGYVVVPTFLVNSMAEAGHSQLTARTDLPPSSWITFEELAKAYDAILAARPETTK